MAVTAGDAGMGVVLQGLPLLWPFPGLSSTSSSSPIRFGLWFPTFSYNCLSQNLMPTSVCSDRSEAEMLRICREGTLYSEEKRCFLYIKNSSQLAARELMSFACLLIFSSPLWPVRLEKHWNIQGQLLRGPIAEFQIDVASRERSQPSKYMWVSCSDGLHLGSPKE